MIQSPSAIQNRRILIAALDWGMGHTTRTAALLSQLIRQNNEIFFAGNELQIDFMRREFGLLNLLKLDGYGVLLDSKKSTYWQMVRQFRKIGRAIKTENRLVSQWVRDYQIDVVISDNRYGFFSPDTPSILLSHQLNLQLPHFKSLVNRGLKRRIEKFCAVWIPDDENHSLSGELSKANFSIPCYAIGALSRFRSNDQVQRYQYLGIVSGPQPARTGFAIKLENYLLRQNVPVALVGYAGNKKGVDYFPNPSTIEMERLLAQSSKIISRAGYTTIMELVSLEKEAILIPTPGQYEQIYLAATLKKPNIQFKKEEDFFA